MASGQGEGGAPPGLSPAGIPSLLDVQYRWKWGTGTAGEGGGLLEVVLVQFLMYLFLGRKSQGGALLRASRINPRTLLSAFSRNSFILEKTFLGI